MNRKEFKDSNRVLEVFNHLYVEKIQIKCEPFEAITMFEKISKGKNGFEPIRTKEISTTFDENLGEKLTGIVAFFDKIKNF